VHIWRQFRIASPAEDDIHMKLNRVYKDVPDWWYGALGLVMSGLAIGVCEGWETQLVRSGYMSRFLMTALVGFNFGCFDCAGIFRSPWNHSSDIKLSSRA
jgi:hypothetical protein